MDYRLELVAVPVSDVDRAKAFYVDQAGFNADHDHRVSDAAHADLSGRGVEVGPVQDFPWGRFVFFADPDGNQWAVQQIVTPS
jgi:predicted enzyme related to lactoylglutathione lyase